MLAEASDLALAELMEHRFLILLRSQAMVLMSVHLLLISRKILNFWMKSRRAMMIMMWPISNSCFVLHRVRVQVVLAIQHLVHHPVHLRRVPVLHVMPDGYSISRMTVQDGPVLLIVQALPPGLLLVQAWSLADKERGGQAIGLCKSESQVSIILVPVLGISTFVIQHLILLPRLAYPRILAVWVHLSI